MNKNNGKNQKLIIVIIFGLVLLAIIGLIIWNVNKQKEHVIVSDEEPEFIIDSPENDDSVAEDEISSAEQEFNIGGSEAEESISQEEISSVETTSNSEGSEEESGSQYEASSADTAPASKSDNMTFDIDHIEVVSDDIYSTLSLDYLADELLDHFPEDPVLELYNEKPASAKLTLNGDVYRGHPLSLAWYSDLDLSVDYQLFTVTDSKTNEDGKHTFSGGDNWIYAEDEKNISRNDIRITVTSNEAESTSGKLVFLIISEDDQLVYAEKTVSVCVYN